MPEISIMGSGNWKSENSWAKVEELEQLMNPTLDPTASFMFSMLASIAPSEF